MPIVAPDISLVMGKPGTTEGVQVEINRLPIVDIGGKYVRLGSEQSQELVGVVLAHQDIAERMRPGNVSGWLVRFEVQFRLLLTSPLDKIGDTRQAHYNIASVSAM